MYLLHHTDSTSAVSMMKQLQLIQSGCQQWIRQPAAIHQSQFAVSSSLAIYIHGSPNYRLLKILAQHTQQLTGICWSPVDSTLLACSTAEHVIKVYHLESEAILYSTQLPGPDSVQRLCWSMHDESVLLAAVGTSIGSWAYRRGGSWKTMHSFKSAITCMQQSATKTRLLAVGCGDCTLHMYDLLFGKVLCTVRLEEGVVPCDVQFDPLSQQYLLLLCRNGSIAMYGIGDDYQLNQVATLAKQPAAERSAAFVPSQPGNFVTISNKTGVLQLWNVSQQQPLRSMKTGKGPAQSVKFFPGSSKALITFQDGSVMVYDVKTQEPLWSTQPGHTETIFDCCFAPHDHKLLATCSYDGSVRVWDMVTGTCQRTFGSQNTGIPAGHEQGKALYSVCWSPDGSQLAAASAAGIINLYSYSKGILTKSLQTHTKLSLKVAWHPNDSNLLASTSADGTMAVYKTDGTKVKVISHPSGASGCAWHPFQKFQLATTVESGAIHVWDLNSPGTSCLLQTLQGHTQRCFSIAWSPLLPDLLLSGGDDATARVWNVASGSCLSLLVGHSSEVRALCWHPEVPWLVFTGSWDCTIRVWDFRSQVCLSACLDHHGDVYGLSIHSACPWVMASASRDTTLRFWDLRSFAAGIMMRCFLLGTVRTGKAQEYASHSQTLLCGLASQQLADWCIQHTKAISSDNSRSFGFRPLSDLSIPDRIEFCQNIAAYFSPPGAAHTLWQLAAAAAAHLRMTSGTVQGSTGLSSQQQQQQQCISSRGSTPTLPVRYGSSGGKSSSINAVWPLPLAESCGFQHVAAARSALLSAASQAELGVRVGCGAIKGGWETGKKYEVLVEAAMLHIQAGNMEHGCDLLAEVNEWDKAVALAPAVSLEYWCKLLQRRTDAMAKAGAPAKELLPLLLATGQTAALTQMLLGQKQFRLAANIAAVQACGGYQQLSASQPSSHSPAAQPAATPATAPGPPCPTCPISNAAPCNLTRHREIPQSQACTETAAWAVTAAAPANSDPLPLLPPVMEPQLQLPQGSATLLVRRNSLPPLKGATPATLIGGSTSTLPRSANAGAGAGAGAAGARSSQIGISTSPVGSPTSPLSPIRGASSSGAVLSGLPLPSPTRSASGMAGSLSGSAQQTGHFAGDKSCADDGGDVAAGINGSEAATAAAAAAVSPLGGPARHPSSSTLHKADCSGSSSGNRPGGGCVVSGFITDPDALAQLVAVQQAQAATHRRQGQPLLAACAALTVDDVTGAITALYLGHEPEQAAMLALALGQLAQVPQQLQDRVYDATARKCEAAGDWEAAAAATKCQSRCAEQRLQLLVVRAERSGKADIAELGLAAGVMPQQPNASSDSMSSDDSTNGTRGLRLYLGLSDAASYAQAAEAARDALESVRYLLLAGDHARAAAKASTHLASLLERLLQQLLAGTAASAADVQPTQQSKQTLQQQWLPEMQELLDWQYCLDSLDPAALVPPCWQEMFAYDILAGAIKAFSYGYHKVGGFLMSSLRHWLEQHQVKFPFNRAALLLLEAEAVAHTYPDTAISLLTAAADNPSTPDNIKSAARHKRQSYSSPAAAAAGDPAEKLAVIAAGSCLPCKPPSSVSRRSVVSGQLVLGPWCVLDDGSSVVSVSEAVMLSHT